MIRTKRVRTPLRWLCVALLTPVSAFAQGPGPDGDPDFFRAVFPPELVMTHQREIGLRDAQRTAITEAIQQTQAKDVSLRWEATDAHAQLTRLIEQPRIDEAEALSHAERMMAVETQIKLGHLALLVRIKNQLDPEQQARLRALRDAPRQP